jgi:ribonuclease P protein component
MNAGFRFPRQKRILSSQEYGNVFKTGNKLYSNGFVLFYKNNDLDIARLGLAIGKKHIPTAVARNRIKRISRETFRQHPELTSYDLVIVVRSGTKSTKKPGHHEIRCSINELWQRLAASSNRKNPEKRRDS